MERCEYVWEAFKRAGVDKPTDDQLDTVCSRLDGMEAKYGSIKLPKLSKKEWEAEADAAVKAVLS